MQRVSWIETKNTEYHWGFQMNGCWWWLLHFFCAVSLATYKISIPLQGQYSIQYEVLWMAVNPDVVWLSAFLVTTLTQTLVVSNLDDYVYYVTKALGLVGDAVSPTLIMW